MSEKRGENGELETEVVKPGPPKPGVRFLKDLSAYKASIVIVLVPILFCPLLFLGRPVSYRKVGR